MPNAPGSFDIAIVGGGIGGACLAVALLRSVSGVSITIYESARVFGEIGAGVSLGPNARRALALIAPELKQAADNVTTYNLGTDKRNIFMDFRVGQHPDFEIKTLEDEHIIASLECEGGQATAHRAHFLDEIVKLIPEGVTQFGKRLARLEDLGDDAGLMLTFSDGTQAIHGCVVGCDGIKSATRKYVLGGDGPGVQASFSGHGCYRGLVPMADAVAAVGHERAMSCNVYLGEGGHVVHFPIGKGSSVAVSALRNMDSWTHDDWTAPTTNEEMMQGFDTWCPTVRGLLPLVQNTNIWAMFDTHDHPLTTYARGAVCLLGDAAHASTPHQGAGAGMAVEDAYVLSDLLRKAAEDTMIQGVPIQDTVKRAFAAYDAVRRPRTQRLVAESREAGDLWSYSLEGFGSDVAKIKANVEQRLKWIWDEDLPAEARAAEKLMDAVQ